MVVSGVCVCGSWFDIDHAVELLLCWQQSFYDFTRLGDQYLACPIVLDVHKSCTSQFQMAQDRTVLSDFRQDSFDTPLVGHITCHVSWFIRCACYLVVHDGAISRFCECEYRDQKKIISYKRTASHQSNPLLARMIQFAFTICFGIADVLKQMCGTNKSSQSLGAITAKALV